MLGATVGANDGVGDGCRVGLPGKGVGAEDNGAEGAGVGLTVATTAADLGCASGMMSLSTISKADSNTSWRETSHTES